MVDDTESGEDARSKGDEPDATAPGIEDTPRARASLLRVREPIAKRLNRNALTVAAVTMGMTVLVAVVLLNPARPAGPEATAPASTAAPPPARPTFLDQPVPSRRTRADSLGLAVGATPSARDTLGVPFVPPPLPMGAPGAAHGEQGLGVSGDERESTPYGSEPNTASERGAPGTIARSSSRMNVFRAALVSGTTVGSSSRGAASSFADAAVGSGTVGESGEENVAGGVGTGTGLPPVHHDARLTVEASGETAVGSNTIEVAPEAAMPGQDALGREGGAAAPSGTSRPSAAIARVEPARSPYTLAAGTAIPAILLTGINSELPGELVAQVSRDVFDTRTQRIRLIPKGAKLVGTYDNRVVASQSRLLVTWTRLLLPDGRSLTLPGLPLEDLQGQTGAAGHVDRHARRTFGHAFLLSLVSAAVQLSQPQQSSVFEAPSARQVAAASLGQQLSEVALEMLRRNMDAPPTITIPAAQSFNVFVTGDLVFDRPYDQPGDGRVQ